MNDQKIVIIVEELCELEADQSIPRNVRMRIKNAITALNDSEKQTEVKVDRALEELSYADSDPNLQQYTRTQIWTVVSALEAR